MDFKYVLQDFSNVYIGMRLTYSELERQDDTPQKLRAAVFRFLQQEAGDGERLCDHIYRMRDDSVSYRVFSQLRGELKIQYPEQVTDKQGRIKTRYRVKSYTIPDFVKDETLKAEITPEQITEYVFKKRYLMSLTV
jgi:transcriptional regulator of NAD metabolism